MATVLCVFSSPDQKAVDEWWEKVGLPECFDQEWNEFDDLYTVVGLVEVFMASD